MWVKKKFFSQGLPSPTTLAGLFKSFELENGSGVAVPYNDRRFWGNEALKDYCGEQPYFHRDTFWYGSDLFNALEWSESGYSKIFTPFNKNSLLRGLVKAKFGD